MIVSATLAIALLVSAAPDIPHGAHALTVDVDGTPLEVFTHKPESYRDGPMILVFHGVLRNAEEYRNDARGMGDRFSALIVAPRFAEDRFPFESYQLGGLKVAGKVQPREKWTWSLIPKLAAEIRRRENRPDMPYYLIGHSGGGQFLIRLAAFVTAGAERIVVANPGTYIFPDRDQQYPLGFGGLPHDLSSDEALRHFLAQPITLYLGKNDTERDEYLSKTPESDRQGATRWQRGQNCFQAAEELARKHGWTFNWRRVEVPDVGHDHEAMFNNPLCAEALFGPKEKTKEAQQPSDTQHIKK
ncbi:MAG TPA: hypothetical protein VGG64_05210 [Pirellulales bacterium]|jgi:poly(3-hydroxybutyrate) depolymerase